MSSQCDLCRRQGQISLQLRAVSKLDSIRFRFSFRLQVPGDVKLNYFDAEGNMKDISVDDLTKGKKVRQHCMQRAPAVKAMLQSSSQSGCWLLQHNTACWQTLQFMLLLAECATS